MRRIDLSRPRQCRHDGWTVERQIDFLVALQTGSVTAAAQAVGMSRESAYRLRQRRNGELFAALWDRSLEAHPTSPGQGHAEQLTDGFLERMLSRHFRA